MTPVLEYVAVALGIAYLLLAMREQRSCWIAGGAASALFLAVFWKAGLPMQAALQLYYVAIALHAWLHWGRPGTPGAAGITRRPASRHALYLLLWLLLSATSLLLLAEEASADSVLDALSSWGGVLATWMVARKELEAWLYWIVIDLLTGVLYLRAGLLPSVGLYLVYTGLAALAYLEWRKHYAAMNSPSASSVP